MISIPIVELNKYLDEQINTTRLTIDNEIENDALSMDMMIRLSTKIKAFKLVKLYINKEE